MVQRHGHRTPLICVLLLLSVGCTVPTTPDGPRRSDSEASTTLTSGDATRVVPSTTQPRHGILHASGRWRLSRAAEHGEIEGYATASSGLPGTQVGLRVSTDAATFRVRAFRIGHYVGGTGRRVWSSPSLRGHLQAAPSFADEGLRTIVARWRTSTTVDTSGWRPGLYVFRLHSGTGWEAHVPYVVSSPSSAGRVALVVPVTTWQAYNDWGGYSLYEGPPADRRSWAVSFDRPYPAPGATEMTFGVVPVVVTAERLGIRLAYFTNLDLELRRDALLGARAYVSTGHDEYWTPAMRRRVEAARDAGTNLVFLGANTMYWRIRIGPEGRRPGRVVTGYRGDAALDPAPPRRRTGRWRDPPEPDPENALTGMRYECFPVDAPFRVAAPGWWGFDGTGIHRGEEFDHLVGVEADRVYPVRGTPRPLQVLASDRYSCRGVPTSAQAVYYTTRSGAAVLNVGTLRWTCALVNRCPADLTGRTVRFVRHVTARVLRDFARGPAAVRHPAHDNVDAFDLPKVNQVPAS